MLSNFQIFYTIFTVVLMTKLCCGQYQDDPLDYTWDEFPQNWGQMNDHMYESMNAGIAEPTPNPVSSKVVQTLQDFSFDIFNATHSNGGIDKNIVISPISIFTAMALLRPGLSGQSLAEVNAALGTESLVNSEIGKALKAIYDNENIHYQLDSANRVYHDNSVPLRKTYKSEIETILGQSGISKRVDFAGKYHESRHKINSYVKRKTRRLINEMLPEGSVNALTQLVLINALYLQANWTHPFLVNSTAQKRFYMGKKKSILTKTMHHDFTQCTFHKDKNSRSDIVVTSLKDNLSMMFIMPHKAGDFSRFFGDKKQSLKSKFKRIIDTIWPEEDNFERDQQGCHLEMPKFVVRHEPNVRESLQLLGVNAIFERETADLSRMTQRNVSGLYVSNAMHKAVLAANEEGIEASAATSIAVQRRLAVELVQINKPFLFAVRQDNTGAILFLGKVINPGNN